MCDKAGDKPGSLHSRICVRKTAVIVSLFRRSFSKSQGEPLGSFSGGVVCSCGDSQWWAVPEAAANHGQWLVAVSNVIWCQWEKVAEADDVRLIWSSWLFSNVPLVFQKSWKLKIGGQPDCRKSGYKTEEAVFCSKGVDQVAASLMYWDLWKRSS